MRFRHPHFSRVFYAAMLLVLAFGVEFAKDRLLLTPPYRLFFTHVDRWTVALLHVGAAAALLVPVVRGCPGDLKWAFPAIGICHMWAAVAIYPFFFTRNEPGNVVSALAWIMVSYGIVRGCVIAQHSSRD